VVAASWPAAVLADESPCTSLYTSAGPAGVDLRAACVADRVTTHYTAATGTGTDIPSTLLMVSAVSWALAVIVLAASRWAGARAAHRVSPVPPSEVWLCDGCRSFNDAGSAACYRCRRPRSPDAPSLPAGEPPSVDQRFGRPFGT
jgi:hypothetical protein